MKTEISLKDTIYNAILKDISSMEYSPGQILNEKQLIEKYNCSKSPVREALLSLSADNELRNIPRYRYEVIRLTKDDIYEMIQFRLILESGILRANYKKLTSVQIAKLAEIDVKCQLDDVGFFSHWDYNTEFHVKLIGFCGSSFAMEELSRCMGRLKRAYVQFYWEKNDINLLSADCRHHSDILNSLNMKDIDGAISHLIEDLSDFGGLENYFL